MEAAKDSLLFIGKFHMHPLDFELMTSFSTHFYESRKCHLS